MLAGRIDRFVELLGNLQPILGATERAFRTIFLAPRSEREQIEREELTRLEGRIDELRAGGIDVELEDPMPLPEYLPAPVTLSDLRDIGRDQFGLEVGQSGRPATYDRERVSRDPTTWTSLATYGHPELEGELRRSSTANRIDRRTPSSSQKERTESQLPTTLTERHPSPSDTSKRCAISERLRLLGKQRPSPPPPSAKRLSGGFVASVRCWRAEKRIGGRRSVAGSSPSSTT